MTNYYCPVCGKSSNAVTVSRGNLITMQNYVYQNYRDALEAPTGEFELCVCRNCGFAYNSRFDSNLLSYDENYDNNVPSSIFEDYYKEIASFLYDNFSLGNGLVIDVGCGKGTFLKTLCATYPNVQGIGIDPSFEAGESANLPPNLKFIPKVFRKEHIAQKPSLIVCRHVLEHMERPVEFLQSISAASVVFPKTPFFVEVPDLEWIVENNSFWDFCYEHCNYFTSGSLKSALGAAGFKTENVRKAFNNQYLWAFGTVEQNRLSLSENKHLSDRLISYSKTERDLMRAAKNKLQELKARGNTIAVWGMATKGVVFCNLIDAQRSLFDYCVDINAKKTECYVPHTGHQINVPEKLREVGSSKLVVVVMNPTYLSEISETCASLNLKPKFIDAGGNELTAVR